MAFLDRERAADTTEKIIQSFRGQQPVQDSQVNVQSSCTDKDYDDPIDGGQIPLNQWPETNDPIYENTIAHLQVYACEDLGDIKVTDSDSFDEEGKQKKLYSTEGWCQSCRGLFPGCRRCVKHEGFSYHNNTIYHCGSCDEGMYLYPLKMTNSTGSSYIVNRCVPDCPTVNFQMVNNPKLGRCEFLGYYCMYGNAQEGCIKSYLQDDLTTLQPRGEIGENYTYGNNPLSAETFMISYINESIQASVDYGLGGGKSFCIHAHLNGTCHICEKGYLIVEVLDWIWDPPFFTSVLTTSCVLFCDEGKYPSIIKGNDTKTMYLEEATCKQCHQSCFTCLLGDSQSCTSCGPGQYLIEVDPITHTGYCSDKVPLEGGTLDLYVTGDRSTNNRSPYFADLLSAITAAYEQSQGYQGMTVTIHLESGKTHYILLNDIAAEPSPSLFIDPYVNIVIISSKCSVAQPCNQKAKLMNKMGPFFKFNAPIGNLTFSNIVIDSIDSVIDHVNSTDAWDCLNSPDGNCCSVDESSTVITCKSIDKTKQFFPTFHKYQSCFTRPSNGIILVPKRHQLLGETRTINIEYCEFHNFFYEMGSFIKVPSYYWASTQSEIKINIQHSLFNKINNCGSVLSNTLDSKNPFNLDQLMTPYFSNSYPLEYVDFLQDARTNYEKKMYQFSGIEELYNYNPSTYQNKLSLNIRSNVFKNFNYLKDGSTDKEQMRKSPEIAIAYHVDVRNLGLILDIQGGLKYSQSSIVGNTFQDSQFYYRNETGPGPDYCRSLLENPNKNRYIAFYFATTYVQFVHLIKFRDISNATIIISENTFTNLSLPGPLIYFEESQEQFKSIFIMNANNFTLIHSYIGTNVLQFKRTLPIISDSIFGDNGYMSEDGWVPLNLYVDYYNLYAKLGGNILIQQNNFKEIIGCPHVDAGLISIAVSVPEELKPELVRLNLPNNQDNTYQQIPQINDFYGAEVQYYLSFIDGSVTDVYPVYDFHLDIPRNYQIQLDNQTFELDSIQTIFSGNSYQEVFMGAGKMVAGRLVPGGLIKLQFVFMVDFIDENFKNVGPYIDEQLVKVLKKIKGTESFLWQNKKAFFDRWPLGRYFLLREQPFFCFNQSQGLIVGHQMIRIRFLGNNVFDNIWLTDRGQPYLKQSRQSLYSFGLILRLTKFTGSLEIGGQNEKDIINTSPITTFNNLVGYLNDYTLENYELWNPQNWSVFPKMITQNSQEYGIGSPLFNFYDESNTIGFLKIKNVIFKNILAKGAADLGASLSTILQIDRNLITQEQVNVIVFEKVEIFNCSVELGASLLNIQGDSILFNQVTVKHIGYFTLYKEPLFKDFILSRQDGSGIADISVINVQYSIEEIQEGIQYSHRYSLYYYWNVKNSTKLLVQNSHFIDLNPALKISAFSFQHIYSFEISYNDFIFENSYFMDNTNISNNIQPISSVFREMTLAETTLRISFKDCFFSNLTATYSIFYVTVSLDSIIFEGCTFQGIIGEKALIFYLGLQKIQSFNLIDSQISGFPVESSVIEQAILAYDNAPFNNPSIITMFRCKNAIIRRTTFSQYHFAKSGAFININQESSVMIEGSQIEDLSAETGGAIAITQKSQLIIKDSLFQRISALRAGVLLGSDFSNISIQATAFKYNRAYKYGVFKIIGDTFFTFQSSKFFKNQAESSHSIGQMNEIANMSSMTDCTFEENQAFITPESQGSKGLEAISCDYTIIFQRCTFKDNIAKTISPNLCLTGASSVIILNSQFFNSKQMDEWSSSISGNFIQIVADSKTYIEKSTFSKGFAQTGGAISVYGGSTLSVIKSQFLNNTADQYGGALMGEGATKITIESSNQFINNLAKNKVGDAIYMKNVATMLSLQDSKFYSELQSNFLDLESINTLDINRCSFSLAKEYKNSNVLKTTGVLLSEIKKLSVKNCNFTGIKSSSMAGGGALRLEETILNKNISNTFLIENCNFENSENINGGAISIINAGNVTINKSRFKNNKASKAGGAILFDCEGLRFTNETCSLNISNSVFIGNIAETEGGVLKWNFYEPIFINPVFENNRALVYGDIKASVAQKLVTIPKEFAGEDKRILVETNFTAQNQTITNVQSGGSFSLFFALIDKYGQILRTNNNSKLFIRTNVNETDTTSVIESSTQFTCEQGIFKVDKLVFVSKPNSTQMVSFSTDGIDTGIPGNMNNNQSNINMPIDSNSTLLKDLNITINLRPCEDGEELLPNGKCQECKEGFYLLRAPKFSELCKRCPSSIEAECIGGNKLFPQPGYWRNSMYSETLLKCRNDEACIGRNEPEDNLRGACQRGYQGVLCADCEYGYSRTGSAYKCSKCPSEEDNSSRIFGVALIFAVAIIVIIRSNLHSSTNQKANFLSAFIRILMNHFQFITLIATFDLEWPPILQQFFQATKPVSEVTTQYISFDCFLDNRFNTTKPMTNDYSQMPQHSDDINRVFFQKVIIFALVPIGVVFLVIIAWQPIFLYNYLKSRSMNGSLSIQPEQTPQSDNKLDDSCTTPITRQIAYIEEIEEKKKEDYKNGRVISSIIIICFLLHPVITTTMFNAFNCQTIEGDKRLFEDLEVQCYSKQHKLIAFCVALPGLILWGLGIPTFAFTVLYLNRNNLQTVEVRSKYGFLYNGYRYPETHYWEIVILYRKIFVIFIQVFLAQQGKIVQAMITMLFLTIFLTLTIIKKPFANHYLNNLESLSMICSIFTVYCGLFYISNTSFKEDQNYSLNENEKTTLFTFIVICHLIFFAYWLYHFIMEIRTTIRNRFPKLYVILFLCCKRNRLYEENQFEQFKEKMVPFVNTIDKAVKYMIKRKKMYMKGQLPIEDEGFKKVLMTFEQFLKRYDKMVEFSSNTAPTKVDFKYLSRFQEAQKNNKRYKSEENEKISSPPPPLNVKNKIKSKDSDKKVKNLALSPDLEEEECSHSDGYYNNTGVQVKHSSDKRAQIQPQSKNSKAAITKIDLKPVKERDEFDSMDDSDFPQGAIQELSKFKKQQRHRDILRKAISVHSSMTTRPLKQLTITTTPLVEDNENEEAEKKGSKNPMKMSTLYQIEETKESSVFVDYLQQPIPRPRRQTQPSKSGFAQSITPNIPTYKFSPRPNSKDSRGSQAKSQSVQSGIHSPVFAQHNAVGAGGGQKSTLSSKSTNKRLIADFVLRSDQINQGGDYAEQKLAVKQTNDYDFMPPLKNLRKSVAQHKKQKEKKKYFEEVMEKGVISRRRNLKNVGQFLTLEEPMSNVQDLRLDHSYSQASIAPIQNNNRAEQDMSIDESSGGVIPTTAQQKERVIQRGIVSQENDLERQSEGSINNNGSSSRIGEQQNIFELDDQPDELSCTLPVRDAGNKSEKGVFQALTNQNAWSP